MRIICGNEKLEPGTVLTPTILTDDNGFTIRPQPLYVVREATMEEYAAQSPLHAAARAYPYYYAVTTD